MRLAKAMNAEQFAKVLFNLEVDEVVEFGLERSYYADENHHIDAEHPLETYDVSDWWFAKRMRIDGYDSEFILVDYCGGTYATAIPLYAGCDEADMKSDVESLFLHIGDYEGFAVNEVYIDMGEWEE